MIQFKSYIKSFRLILSLLKYDEKKPPPLTIKIEKYHGLQNSKTPVKVIFPKNINTNIVIMYPGASPTAEEHPKLDMLGRLLAQIGFTVYIPRIPPLKELDVSEINVKWFVHFYKWIINIKKINSNNILMIGISYGGGIMLKSLIEIEKKFTKPKTLLTYGTYSSAETVLNFLLSGEINNNGKLYKIKPNEWGLVVLFHNYLKNLKTEWDSTQLQNALEQKIHDNMKKCNELVNKLPEPQKQIFYSIINSKPTKEIEKLAYHIIKNEKQNLLDLSPISWGNKIQNKIFILHGIKDTMVPFTESIQLAKILPNSELFISHLYKHNEPDNNGNKLFIFNQIIKLIYFYSKLFDHYEN